MKTKEILIQKQIVKGASTKSLKIYNDICPDFTKYATVKPSVFVENIWNSYKKLGNMDNSVNGKVFELILASILVNYKITPFYMQAQLTFVHNVDFDILLYTDKGYPIVLSAKTSLRERYKQADLEADALKSVHRLAKCYLLTLSDEDASAIKDKISAGDIVGIDDILCCINEDFDHFIEELQKIKYIIAQSVPIIKNAGAVVE